MPYLVLEAEAARSRAAVGEWVFTFVNVGGRADGNVFVQRRLLLVPGDTHSGAFGEDKMELSAENTCSAGGSGLAKLLQWRPLLSNDHLNDQVVLDTHAARALHVAQRLHADVACRLKLNIDLALFKVRLPASLDLLVGNGADILVEDTLAFAPDLGDMLGASWGNELLRLLDAPVELAKPPACLRIGLVLHDARKTHLDGKVADWVDDRR